MVNGGDCSLCRSKGTNKRNCPLNANAKQKNTDKHYKIITKRKKNVSFNSISPRIHNFTRKLFEHKKMFNSKLKSKSIKIKNRKKQKKCKAGSRYNRKYCPYDLHRCYNRTDQNCYVDKSLLNDITDVKPALSETEKKIRSKQKNRLKLAKEANKNWKI